MNFQETPSNGRRQIAEKANCSKNKVPLITDRSQPNLQHLQHMRRRCKVWIFRKIHLMKSEIQPRRH